ncbi:MAG: hypothetical protein H7Y61_19185 [Rhizobiales bacterium]|nr:hypothetical protein [Rhizobacter sp.]
MTRARPTQYFAATQRAVTQAVKRNADAIEWEELPSLARRVVPRGANDAEFLATSSFGRVWDNTMPASLDISPPSQPFSERIEGLATREVNEPGIFRHFFGEANIAR